MTYQHTRYASYLGNVTQAIINNLAPLLFLTFQREFDISLERIGLLISLNFGIQIVTDLIAARLVDKIGYRISAVLSHGFCAAGLLLLGVLPYVADPYWGLVMAISLSAVGGGMTEVIISPIVESLPSDQKASDMSLLHSFYSWGQVAVVLLSTLYFVTVGAASWRFLPMIWAVIPAFNLCLFTMVPMCTLVEEAHKLPLKKLFAKKIFWLFLVLMLCAGASEIAMSQWSSLFAEAGLGVSKTVGDLLGPCAFAVLMGLSRMFYGVKGQNIKMGHALLLSCALCVASYLLTALSKNPFMSLFGCALCGLSVGLMWPGVYSLSAQCYPQGGTAMFAMLALAGDAGCTVGPALVGVISEKVQSASIDVSAWAFLGQTITEVSLKAGMLTMVLFPAIMLIGVFVLLKKSQKN